VGRVCGVKDNKREDTIVGWENPEWVDLCNLPDLCRRVKFLTSGPSESGFFDPVVMRDEWLMPGSAGSKL
jgi:hypothetical protein